MLDKTLDKTLYKMIPEELKDKLETMAGVTEDMYEYTERGIKFTFDRSLVANQCHIIKYHDKVIVEFRKKASNIIEGNYDKLISEEVISIDDLTEHFESKTGIYLSYI